MAKNIINLLPREIIYQWIDKYNSKVCKLWHAIWCTKPMTIRSPNNHTFLRENINYPLSGLSKFKNLITLMQCHFHFHLLSTIILIQNSFFSKHRSDIIFKTSTFLHKILFKIFMFSFMFTEYYFCVIIFFSGLFFCYISSMICYYQLLLFRKYDLLLYFSSSCYIFYPLLILFF